LKSEITKKNNGESTDYLVSEIGSFLGTSSEIPEAKENETKSDERGNKNNFTNQIVLEENTKIRLTLQYQEDFTTSILLTIDGSDFKFTTNLSKAAIIETSVDDFEALKSEGKVGITIENIGDNASKFEIGLHCSKTIEKVPSISTFLLRMEQRKFEFKIKTNEEEGKEHECDVVVSNAIGEEVARETIIFKTKELQEVYVEDETYENYEEDKVREAEAGPMSGKQDYTDFDANVICNFLCPMMTNLFCLVITGCFQHLIIFSYGILIILGILIGGSFFIYCVFCRKQTGDGGEKKKKEKGNDETRESNSVGDNEKDEKHKFEMNEMKKLIQQLQNQNQNKLAIEDVETVKRRKRKRRRKNKRKYRKEESSESEGSMSESNSESVNSESESEEEFESPVKEVKKRKKKIKKRKKQVMKKPKKVKKAKKSKKIKKEKVKSESEDNSNEGSQNSSKSSIIDEDPNLINEVD
jgi:hypothetical protein